nr:hypothetical protein [Okeania sp. SIO3B5]
MKLTACIGNQFDLKTLAIISGQSTPDAASHLWEALQDGLILPTSQVYKFFQDTHQGEADSIANATYRFLHDRVQQAAYTLIPEEDKAANHYRLGCLLQEKLSPEEQEQQVFEIVSQLNYGLPLISTFTDRRQLSQLNLKAGRKARVATAYAAAKHYFSVGIQLLADEGWETEQVLTRQLHEEVAEIALLKGEIELANDWLDTILQKTPNLLDQMRAYELRLLLYQSQGQQREALREGLHILKQLGIVIPETQTLAVIQQQVESTLSLVDETKISELIDLPNTQDETATATMKILITLGPSAYQSEHLLFLLVACEAFKVSLQDGCTELSAPAYSDFGLAVSGTLNRPEIGYQFGRLAVALADRLQLKAIQCIAGFKAAAFLLWAQQPLKDAVDHLGRCYVLGLEAGDSIHTIASMVFNILYGQFSGDVPLDELRGKAVTFSSELSAFLNYVNWSNIVGQTIDNFINVSSEPEVLTGHFCDETTLVKMMEDGIDRFAIYLFLLGKLILSYTFGKVAIALETTERGINYLDAGSSTFLVPVFHFYDALSRLAGSVERESGNGQCIESSSPGKLSLESSRKKLRAWAECAPMNFLPKNWV